MHRTAGHVNSIARSIQEQSICIPSSFLKCIFSLSAVCVRIMFSEANIEHLVVLDLCTLTNHWV